MVFDKFDILQRAVRFVLFSHILNGEQNDAGKGAVAADLRKIGAVQPDLVRPDKTLVGRKTAIGHSAFGAAAELIRRFAEHDELVSGRLRPAGRRVIRPFFRGRSR